MTECPPGTFGTDCSSKCPSGFFGKFCRQECLCNAHDCNSTYGCALTIGKIYTLYNKKAKQIYNINSSLIKKIMINTNPSQI